MDGRSPFWSRRLAESKLDCACDDGFYVDTPCVDKYDAKCAPCSTACADGYYIVTPCSEYADVACTECRSCGYPNYAAGGCSGTLDRICAKCTVCDDMEYELSPCAAGEDRVCFSCARDSECAESTDRCANVARWWHQANCCYDGDGTQVTCDTQLEANLRIANRNSRRHWVYDVLPRVEAGYEQGDAATV